MRYREEQDVHNGIDRAIIEFNLFDFVMVKLDWQDRILLQECNKSTSVADKLLALEMIARKIEGERNESYIR